MITESSGPASATIERVSVQVSKAWTCDTELVTVAPRHAESRRRGDGRLTHFAGRTTGECPSDRSGRVRLDLLAHPDSQYHRGRLRLTDNVEYVEWAPETLLATVAEQ